GISGNKDGLPELPDGEFLPGFPLNIVEKYFKEQVESKYPGRKVISARCAHLSKPNQIHIDQGRVQCQNRLLCQRGCPFCGYFSSPAAPPLCAAKNGTMKLNPDSVVHSIFYYDDKGKAIGLKVIDRNTKEEFDFFGKLIFVNAAALN